jgi:hypothetical protein
MALYEDNYVCLDESSVTLKLYYFPFGDITISRENIKDIQTLENPGFFETKMWGMALSSVWWAFGWKMNIEDPKKLFVIKTNDDWVGKGFVCCDGDTFMTAYRRNVQVH